MVVKTIKKLLHWMTSYLIRLLLFGTILTAVIITIAGSSSSIKEVLDQTNGYDRFVSGVIESNKKQPLVAGSLDYSDPVIIRIFNDSFPSYDLRSNTEGVIDNIYLWLNKKSPSLEFSVDFTKNKQLFAEKLTDYAFIRLSRLPSCKTPPTEVNPLTIACKPQGYDAKDVRESYKQQLIASDTFLGKTKLTASDLPKNSKGKTLPEQYSFAPRAFAWLRLAPYILGALSVLTAILYIITSPKKRQGVSGVGIILGSTGVTLAIFPIFFDYVLPRLTDTFKVESGTSGTQAIFSDAINHLTRHFDELFISIGIQMAIVGLSIYLLERATRGEVDKYKNIVKKAGLQSGTAKQPGSPKSLKNKLSNSSVPIQSSDLPAKANPKQVSRNNKYRKLYSKKGL